MGKLFLVVVVVAMLAVLPGCGSFTEWLQSDSVQGATAAVAEGAEAASAFLPAPWNLVVESAALLVLAFYGGRAAKRRFRNGGTS
jgi:hypothetical protein